MSLKSFCIACAAVFATLTTALAQPTSPEGAFTFLPAVPADVAALRENVRPNVYQAVRVNWDALRVVLATAPLEDSPAAVTNPLVMTLPMPEGYWARFRVVESPIMEPGLAAAFPDIKTYLGQGLDDPAASVRFDSTMHGFHAQILSPIGAVYIDPYSFGDLTTVTSYYKRDLTNIHQWHCDTIDDGLAPAIPAGGYAARAVVTRRNLRLAVSATGEYTAFFGGTQAAGQAAIVTAINRVNQVYEIDLGVRLVLVTNNQNLVFTNSGTDPYNNQGGTTDRDQCQTQCDTIIGSANYDIGHVFEQAPGGVSTIGTVCLNGNKGRGLSGFTSPTGDPFVIDYVAHEIGHQFSGRHCFNDCGGGPGDSFTYAYEPGSGSTIMAYAGICGSDNLQAHSDPQFSQGSLAIMIPYVASLSCPTNTATTNNPPTVTTVSSYTIPANTPFALTASASDPDGNALTYSWEERDNSATTAVPLPLVDNGLNPIIRVFAPSTSPTRTVPRLTNLLNNTFAIGEILPTTARTLNFRVVVRDNIAGGGGVATANTTLNVVNVAGLAVTSPNTGVSWSGARTVTWNVGGTSASPINCANVRISLSTDSGATYPTILANSVPNNGSANITLPSVTTATARIKVEAIGNIFFDISNTNFSITPPPVPNLSGNGSNTVTDTTPSGNSNGVIDPGETNIQVRARVINTGGVRATNIVGTLSSRSPTVTVTAASSASSAYPNLNTNGNANNTTPYTIDISPTHVCGDPVNLRLTITCTEVATPFIYDFSFATGPTCQPPLGGTCDPDLNQDGNVDQGDIDYLVNVVAGGPNPIGVDPDFNADGNVDQGDIDALVNVVAGGACP
ncbi:MAG: reprolysin-like metallopeptidase [Phycisphaerales bacterium]|jgi:hypothetical protein